MQLFSRNTARHLQHIHDVRGWCSSIANAAPMVWRLAFARLGLLRAARPRLFNSVLRIFLFSSCKCYRESDAVPFWCTLFGAHRKADSKGRRVALTVLTRRFAAWERKVLSQQLFNYAFRFPGMPTLLHTYFDISFVPIVCQRCLFSLVFRHSSHSLSWATPAYPL